MATFIAMHIASNTVASIVADDEFDARCMLIYEYKNLELDDWVYKEVDESTKGIVELL